MSTSEDSLKETGRGAAASIVEMVAALECDYDRIAELEDTTGGNSAEEEQELRELKIEAGECTSREEAETRIQEDALSVEVRSGWCSLGEELKAEEFNILLATGGPAVRILGELRDGEAYRAWLEVQDWGTPWTRYFDISQDTLLAYARCFYFGEG